MSFPIKCILSALIGFLLGSFNLAIILSDRILKKDIRKMGSGNAGGTNVSRTMGWQTGISVVFFDALKGVVSMILGNLVGGHTGFLLAGFCCVIGHVFPVFYSFRGGKGVATGAAVFAMIDWRCGLIIIGVFLISVILTKYVSLGSVLGAICFPISWVLLNPFDLFTFLGSALITLLVVIKHWGNIVRIVKGEERKFSFKRNKQVK